MMRAEMRRHAAELELRGVHVAVLRVIMDHMSADGGPCTVAVETMCDESGFRERAVQKALRTLVAKGIISERRRPAKTTEYLAITENAPRTACTPQEVHPAASADEGKNPVSTTPVSSSTLASSGVGTQPAEGPPRTRATRTPARLREANPIWDALAAVSLSIENDRQRSRFAGVVKRMTAAGYTPDQITEQGERLTREWRRPVCAWQVEDYWQEASNVVPLNAADRWRAAHA